ncbi:MAG: hypothetical protein AAF570_13205 [Bacteroidota bacterium]
MSTTTKYPIDGTVIKLDLENFQILVFYNDELEMSFKEGDPPFRVALEDTDFVITTESELQEFQKDLVYDTIRSFEISEGIVSDCRAGVLGVIDIRDCRCSNEWCLEECYTTLQLTKKEVPVRQLGARRRKLLAARLGLDANTEAQVLVVSSASDQEPCYSENCEC